MLANRVDHHRINCWVVTFRMEKERQEVDRLHNLNEDDWRNEVRNNPKVITNKAVKGKYKFLQKYYHRGAFFLVSRL